MAKLSMPAPKRVAPPEVPPITVGNQRFEPILWGKERGLDQNGGYLLVKDSTTGAELGVIQVYRIDYQPRMETDVQDVFIRTLEAGADGKTLIVTDEKSRRFIVDIDTRQARPAP